MPSPERRRPGRMRGTMDATTQVNELLGRLGEFALDADGRCLIEHESGVQFAVETVADAEFVTFYAPLIEVPAECPANFLKRALHLNLLQVHTRGGSVAFDPDSGWLVLSLSADLEGLDQIAFENVISNLVPTALSLKEELTGTIDGPPARSEPAVPDEGSSGQPAGGVVRV